MKKKNPIRPCILLVMVVASLLMISCKTDPPLNEDTPVSVFGYEFLNKIPGLWNGPVTSSTAAGNFSVWYVDFRPVSAAQVSQFSLLDTSTINNTSFFIVRYNNRLKVAMRTEGCANNQCCVTYEQMDSVSGDLNYYRFSDFVLGKHRAYTEFRFKPDSMTMKVYTNKFDTLQAPVLHATWTASLATRSNAAAATAHFNYPQPVMVKDFSNAFPNMPKGSIFFEFENDPYQSVTQPYVGSVTVNISIDSALTTSSSDKIFLLFTTEPLFVGGIYNSDNLKYISKYVYLSHQTTSFKIRNIHPGTYYIYSLIDRNHDNLYLTGDYMNSNFTNSFTVVESQDASVNTNINYIIP